MMPASFPPVPREGRGRRGRSVVFLVFLGMVADIPVVMQPVFQQFSEFLVPQFQFLVRVLDIPVMRQRRIRCAVLWFVVTRPLLRYNRCHGFRQWHVQGLFCRFSASCCAPFYFRQAQMLGIMAGMVSDDLLYLSVTRSVFAFEYRIFDFSG